MKNSAKNISLYMMSPGGTCKIRLPGKIDDFGILQAPPKAHECGLLFFDQNNNF